LAEKIRMMQIQQLSEEDFYQKLGQAHNSPGSDLSEEEFAAEYYRLYGEIEIILARHGKNDAYGEGDYYLEPRIVDSRGLGLEVTNPNMISPKLISELSDAVRRINPLWEIYLGSGECDFGVFVSASGAKMWKRDDSSLLFYTLAHQDL
jgi:hypothetical protein